MSGIVDTHVHIWDFGKANYPWLEGDQTILNRSYHLSELTPQIGKAGVTHGVLVQAANNIEDTLLHLNTAMASDWIVGVVGWLPLTNPTWVRNILTTRYGREPLFKGCRHLIHNEKDPKWLLQPEVIESLKILARYSLPYDVVGVLPEHIETALKVSELVPDLKMVFDHLNQPPIALNERFGRWGELTREAAKNPNFYAKISGLGTTVNKGKSWRKEDIKPYVLFALEQFGTNRCFCGGDWPVSLLAGEYETAWNVYKSILKKELPDEEQEKVLRDNAIKFYNLNIDLKK